MASLATLVVMRQGLFAHLKGEPNPNIPLDAPIEEILGDAGELSTQFVNSCFEFFMLEKNSTPLDDRPKHLRAEIPLSGKRSSTTSK